MNILEVLQKKIKVIVLIISIILFGIGSIINSFNMMLCAIMVVLMNNIVFSLFNIKENIVFLVFNITFFTLLLSGNLISMLSNEVWYNKFDKEIEKNTLLLLYLSLICIWFGNRIYRWYKNYIEKYRKYKKIKNDFFDEEIVGIRKFLKIMFFATLVPAIIMVIEEIIFINQNAYVDLHTKFASKIPFLIQKLANTNFTFLMLYLSTFPKRKDSLIVTGIYCIYLIATIFTGGRGSFVIGIIVFIIYYIYRQYTFKEKYINKKVIIIMGIVGIVVIIFLSSYNVWRNKATIENFNLINQFKQFFIDQSGSVNLISYVQKYKDQLPDTNKNYTFGILINVLLNNNEYISKTNTENTALYGNNLGATLSYLVMKSAFLRGHGLGTQYIAELYVDFSYAGVIVYNIILGFGLSAIMNIRKENYIGFAIGLNLISNLIYLPRQFAMGWCTYLMSSTIILSVILTFGVSRIIRRRLKYENSLDS